MKRQQRTSVNTYFSNIVDILVLYCIIKFPCMDEIKCTVKFRFLLVMFFLFTQFIVVSTAPIYSGFWSFCKNVDTITCVKPGNEQSVILPSLFGEYIPVLHYAHPCSHKE